MLWWRYHANKQGVRETVGESNGRKQFSMTKNSENSKLALLTNFVFTSNWSSFNYKQLYMTSYPRLTSLHARTLTPLTAIVSCNYHKLRTRSSIIESKTKNYSNVSSFHPRNDLQRGGKGIYREAHTWIDDDTGSVVTTAFTPLFIYFFFLHPRLTSERYAKKNSTNNRWVSQCEFARIWSKILVRVKVNFSLGRRLKRWKITRMFYEKKVENFIKDFGVFHKFWSSVISFFFAVFLIFSNFVRFPSIFSYFCSFF